MPQTATSKVEVGLNYESTVLADAPEIYWRMNEASGATSVVDSSGNGWTGTVEGTGTITMELASPVPTGLTAFSFDGSNDYLEVDEPVIYQENPFSFEAWIWLSTAGMGTLRTIWQMRQSSGVINPRIFYVRTTNKLGVADSSQNWVNEDTTTLSAETWYHVVAVSDGTNIKFYINGTLSSSAANIVTFETTQATGSVRLSTNGADAFDGRIDEVAAYQSVLSPARVLAHYQAGNWTDFSADVLGGVRARYGISGNGPTDCVAGTGEMSFDLNNGTGNSAGLLGYYSPEHANAREGWTYGIPIKWTITHSSTDYVRFRGKVGSIDPQPGQYRSRRVSVVAYDVMRDLVETPVREVTIQVSQQEDDLIGAILDSLPVGSQPVARSIATGIDTFPYAFDNVGPGTRGAALLKDVVLSVYGTAFVRGDGTFVYKTRTQRTIVTSAVTLADASLIDLDVPSALDRAFNRTRVVIHPKTVDAAATTVLWAQSGTAPDIAAGASLTVWGTYRDPSNTLKLVGGTAQVTPIVATTDYTANSQADGGGSDLTANISVSTTAFASTVKFVVTNNGASTAYLTALQIRGKGIYDNGPRTLESYTEKDYGDRPVEIDMPYQDDVNVGSDTASYVTQRFSGLDSAVDSAEFVANDSSALMVHALTREPTDCISLTEAVTGLSAATVIIQSVETTWVNSKHLTCRWGVAPAGPLFSVWQLGTAGATELGTTTVLGF